MVLKQLRKFCSKNILRFKYGSNHLMVSSMAKIHGRRTAGSRVKTKKLEISALTSLRSLLGRSTSGLMKK